MGRIQGSIVHRIFPKAPFFPDHAHHGALAYHCAHGCTALAGSTAPVGAKQHLAVQEADDDGQTTYWGEHVTDEEYQG